MEIGFSFYEHTLNEQGTNYICKMRNTNIKKSFNLQKFLIFC